MVLANTGSLVELDPEKTIQQQTRMSDNPRLPIEVISGRNFLFSVPRRLIAIYRQLSNSKFVCILI
jgi:hypothetical protein